MLNNAHDFRISKLAITIAAALVMTGCNDSNDTSSSPVDSATGINHDAKGWSLVWSDEFDGSSLDRSKWSHEVNCWGGGNNEQQCYVDKDANSFVDAGVLHLKAIREETTGPIYNPEHPEFLTAGNATLPFSSARLRTVAPVATPAGSEAAFDFRHDWRYGRLEIRAKLPQGQGTWPAIWMLPTDYVYGGWAASGEIDIMEAVNLHTTYKNDKGETVPENRVNGTLHFGRSWPNNVNSGTAYDFGDANINPADDFHTYSIEWEEGEVRWYVDNVHYATQTMDGWYSHYKDSEGNWVSGSGAAPFDQNFHLILNLAMGGGWAGNTNDGGIADSIQQQEMLVDYVRVYQCDADLETGKGCATVGENAKNNAGIAEPELPTGATVDVTGDKLVLFADSLSTGLTLDGWDPDGVNQRDITDAGTLSFAFNQSGTNAYLHAANPVDMTTYASGELSMAIKVVSGTADALTVKLDSGYPSLAPIDIAAADLPAAGEWKTFTFPVADFMSAGVNGFDIAKIVNPVVFEPKNNQALQIEVDNIQFTKPISELPVFIDATTTGYVLDGYTPDAADSRTVTDAGTLDAQFTGAGNLFFTASPALDMSAYKDWTLNFDLKVISLGTNSDIMVKMDSGWPNVSDLDLSAYGGLPVAGGEFQSYSIPVQDFINASNRIQPGKMDITKVANPVVFEGLGGENLHIELDNIRFSAP